MALRLDRRPWPWVLHSILGVKLSLLLLFVCGTGTIATVSNEIEWLYRPSVRATATDAPVSWGAQYAAARAAYPHYVITFGSAGEGSYLANSFFATSPSGQTRVIFVDPAAGQVTGEHSWVSLPSIMRALHYHLFTDRTGSWLFYIVCALGLVLIGSVVTGLLTHRSVWRGFFRAPRRDRGARVLAGDMHRLLGLWTALFALLIGATSIWYFAERAIEEVVGLEYERFPASLPDSSLDRVTTPRRLPLDAAITIAQREIPELVVKSIWFPLEPNDPFFIRGQASAWFVRDRTNGVEINPFTGAVIHVDRAERMLLIERWVHTADPLHFGDFAGLFSKLAWFVFGLFVCALCWSGVSINIHRLTRGGSVGRRA